MAVSLTFDTVGEFISFVNGVTVGTSAELTAIMSAIQNLQQQGNTEMALLDDITAALASLNAAVAAAVTDIENFAADLAAALANNNTAAAQAALDGINASTARINAAVAANQAPAPTGATGGTGATGP